MSMDSAARHHCDHKMAVWFLARKRAAGRIFLRGEKRGSGDSLSLLRDFFAAGTGASSSALRDGVGADVVLVASGIDDDGGVSPSAAVGLEGAAVAVVAAGPGLLGFFMKNLEIDACLNPPPAPPPAGFSFGILKRASRQKLKIV